MSQSITQKFLLVPLAGIFLKTGKYTSKVRSSLEKSTFIGKVADLVYGKGSLKDTNILQLIVRLLIIATILAVLGTAVGYFCFDKIGWAFQEGRPITLLSYFMLLTVGFIFGEIWNVANSGQDFDYKSPKAVWWFLSWGFYVAAWDELLRLHETLDRRIHKLLGVKPTHITDHLDDMFVAMYGVVGIIILVHYRKEIMRFVSVWPYFIGAALMGIVSVVVDVLCADKPFLMNYTKDTESLQYLIDTLDIIEECFKIFSEIFFVGLVVAIYQLYLSKVSDPEQSNKSL